MKSIKLYYDSAEIKISTYLLLYFRVSGIYVYEKFLDLSNNWASGVQAFIEEKNRISSEDICPDAHIFIISEENRHQLTDVIRLILALSGKSFVVALHNTLSEADMQLLVENKIDSVISNNTKNLLGMLLKKFQMGNILSEEEYGDLRCVYRYYWEYKLRDILVASRFFYKKQETSDFEILSSKFMDAITSIPAQDINNYTWHVQYARLYLAYEYNMLCKSLDKRLICSKEYIVNKLKEMLKVNELRDNCQLVLLLAQTYDDLFREYNIAYEYYLLACTKKNAFAYFKKGEYWNIYGKNSMNAIKYYEKSISLFPEYHKAWYNLGVSCLNLGNTRRALGTFEYINVILRKKKQCNHLSETDIEYLYKANCLSGYIYYKYYTDYSKALQSDFQALEIWKMIDENSFGIGNEWKFSDIGKHERLKKKLDVEKLKRAIYHMLEIIGDKELALKFRDKVQ